MYHKHRWEPEQRHAIHNTGAHTDARAHRNPDARAHRNPNARAHRNPNATARDNVSERGGARHHIGRQ